MLETYDDPNVFTSSANPASSVVLEEDSPAVFRRRVGAVRVARKGALAIADQLVFGATSFVTTIFIARAADSTELGLYALGLSLALVGQDVQNQLVLIPYTVYYPRLDEAGRRHIFASALLQTAGLGFLSFLVFGMLACLAPLGMHPLGASGTCLALAVAIPLLYLRQHARMISFAHMRMEAALGLDLLVGALQVGGIFLLAQLGFGVSATSAYLASAIACAVAVGCWLWPKRQALAISPMQVLKDLRRSWDFSRWLLATSPIAILRSQLPLWLLTAFHGTAATGLYSACMNIASLANPFITGVGNFAGTKAAHANAEGGKPALRRFILGITGFIGVAMGCFFLFLLVFGDGVMHLAYGDRFANLGGAMAVLAGSVFVASMSSPAFRGLLALEKSRITLTTECLMLLVQVSLGLWLVMRFGVLGAAWAILAANAAGMIYQVVMFLGNTRMNASRMGGNDGIR